MENNGRHIALNSRARAGMRAQQATHHLLMRIFVVVIAVAVAFCGGFVLRGQTELMASWGVPLTDAEQQALSQISAQGTSDESVSARVADVERILTTFSMDHVDITQATHAAIDGLMKSTGDPYATYYSPELYNNYIKETSDRSYASIGVVFADYNGRAYVADVFGGSEAEAKGVQQGDFVDAIDGEDTSAWSMVEVVNALSQDEGSEVSITWMRPSSVDAQTGDQFTTSLVCKVYEEANLSTELRGDVGIIKVRQITQNAADLVKQATESLIEQGAASLVLDLRDNAGGYLTQAVDIASLFIESGVVVEVQTNEGSPTAKSAAGKQSITQAPMVVLVNEYTAAAAEVLTAALQDNQRATVVGETTLGKGSVQVVRELDFGGAVRYTAAYYLTPLGQAIDGVGVVPQIGVAASEDEAGADTQMTVAVDTARSLVVAS